MKKQLESMIAKLRITIAHCERLAESADEDFADRYNNVASSLSDAVEALENALDELEN